ncbi:MAG: DNA modification methylase [Deltaproteobacteria bacterium]|nr:DNA modification methylase [Deltaproteobacteria bacterium]
MTCAQRTDHFERVAIDELRQHPRNPRKGNVDAIVESISKNGFYGAIVVQRSTRYILAGNHRWLAAKRAGMPDVPVLWADVDDKTARRILLADNRTSDVAKYDDPLLASLLKELRAEMDLAGSGYAESDVDALLKSIDGGEAAVRRLAAVEEADEAPAQPTGEPESRRGEIYQLGPHRLMCGDSTSVTDVEALLAGAKVDLLWTDPPYNVGYVGGTSRKLTIVNDSMSDEDFLEFLVEAFSTASTAMRAGACFYIAHADTQGLAFRSAVRNVGWKLSQCLVWAKDRFVLGRQDYHWRHEPILYGWKEGAPHHAVADRTQDTVWECPRPTKNEEHPTMKPVALIERALRNSTNEGDRVLDLFGGSGSTLIAAARTGRVAYLMEIDPRYCDVIRRRYAKLAGDAAEAAPDAAA